MGDLNAKVVGRYGLGSRNERGDMWVDWCMTHDQVIMNTWFQHHKTHLYTWKSPGDGMRNQLDYITINKRFRNSILQVYVFWLRLCGWCRWGVGRGLGQGSGAVGGVMSV